MYAGIVRSEESLQREPIASLAWRTSEICPPACAEPTPESLREHLANKKGSVVSRNRPAYTLAWIERVKSRTPIVLSGLAMNDVSLLHLPAESFIEYQLLAQKKQPDRFVATAAYGDGGPWYIPTADAYSQGGYEVGVAFCSPEVEKILSAGIEEVIKSS
jgi:hypothetical protein